MKPIATVLIVFDLLTVTLFSLGGIAFHSLGGEPWAEFWRIALPFFIGYPLGVWAAGAYDRTVEHSLFVRNTCVGLTVGLLNSFFLRAVQRGEVPLTEFVLPSILFFVVCVVLSRGTFQLLTHRFKL